MCILHVLAHVFITCARLLFKNMRPGVLVRLLPAEVLTDMVVGLTELIDQIINVLQGHFLRFKDPPARLSATLPVLNAFNRLRPNTQGPPNQTASSQASLLQKSLPAPPLPSEIRRVSFPIASWSGSPVTCSNCSKRHLKVSHL